MPKKKAPPRSDAEDLTLELARRLAASREGTPGDEAPAGASPPAGEAGSRAEAVDELMKRYSRSKPRRARSGNEPPKE